MLARYPHPSGAAVCPLVVGEAARVAGIQCLRSAKSQIECSVPRTLRTVLGARPFLIRSCAAAARSYALWRGCREAPVHDRGSYDPGRKRRAGWQSPRAAIPRPVAPARERRVSDRHLRSIRRRSGRMVPRRMAALVTDALHHRTTRPILARPALLVRIAQLAPKCLGCAGSWSTAENERQRCKPGEQFG